MFIFIFFELFRLRLAEMLSKRCQYIPTNFFAKIRFRYHKNATFDDELESIEKCK
jgi:hypothetical protein